MPASQEPHEHAQDIGASTPLLWATPYMNPWKSRRNIMCMCPLGEMADSVYTCGVFIAMSQDEIQVHAVQHCWVVRVSGVLIHKSKPIKVFAEGHQSAIGCNTFRLHLDRAVPDQAKDSQSSTFRGSQQTPPAEATSLTHRMLSYPKI